MFIFFVVQWGRHHSGSSTLLDDDTVFKKTSNSPDYSGCMGAEGSNSGTVLWTLKVKNFGSSTPSAHVGVCTPEVFDPEKKFFQQSENKGKAFAYK